jgi:deazaflavin-dependent oxidoreductase (nitroreductase family)
MSASKSSSRYVEPGWFTKNIFNRIVQTLTGMGISVWGSRALWVRGRSSGEWRSNPVNLLSYGGDYYLVAPRGVTQWVRNLRVAGDGELRLGRKVQAFEATELDNTEKIEVLKAYLQRWKVEVGVFFDGVSATSSTAELDRIAPNHPVFRLTFAKAQRSEL